MILTCPACGTRYQADETKFPPEGRRVRCAKCGHVWHQPGLQAPPKTETAQTPEPTPKPEPALSGTRAFAPAASVPEEPKPFPTGRALAVAAGWIGLILVVLGIGYAAVRYREEIAMIWPQSAGVYSSLGLKIKARGISLDHVTYHRENENGQTVLSVTGDIVNSGTRELPVPQNILVTLSDNDHHELYHWTFTPKVQTLKPGQSSAFSTRLASPPAAARHLEVRFASNG